MPGSIGEEGARGREASYWGGWSQPGAARWLLPPPPVGAGRPHAPAAPPRCRSRLAPRLPDAWGAETGRVSDLSRGTAWTLHLTALPNAPFGWERPAAALWNVRERSLGQG